MGGGDSIWGGAVWQWDRPPGRDLTTEGKEDTEEDRFRKIFIGFFRGLALWLKKKNAAPLFETRRLEDPFPAGVQSSE
jgi:hypothetical protein